MTETPLDEVAPPGSVTAGAPPAAQAGPVIGAKPDMAGFSGSKSAGHVFRSLR